MRRAREAVGREDGVSIANCALRSTYDTREADKQRSRIRPPEHFNTPTHYPQMLTLRNENIILGRSCCILLRDLQDLGPAAFSRIPLVLVDDEVVSNGRKL